MELYTTFQTFSIDAERFLANLANPNYNYDQRATKDYPLTSLHDALLITGVYLLIVIYGISRYESKERESKKVSLFQSFIDEPIKIFQVVYNIVQVRETFVHS
jgi:3'-phosphoadenosine 5'-phosphosulfate sulfotransferase (PAPS reductase)/FAD synthetase